MYIVGLVHVHICFGSIQIAVIFCQFISWTKLVTTYSNFAESQETPWHAMQKKIVLNLSILITVKCMQNLIIMTAQTR